MHLNRRVWLVVALVGLVACGGGAGVPVIPVDGDPVRGREAIIDHGCGACHSIPGVPEANTYVGPPLDAWSRRAFVAGTLPNSPDNVARFIADPAEIRPDTAMPDLELDDEAIASIVAYLFTLD